MGDDGGIAQGGGVIRLKARGGLKMLISFRVTATLGLHQAEPVECFGQSLLELEGLAETLFGAFGLTRAQLGGPQFEPARG